MGKNRTLVKRRMLPAMLAFVVVPISFFMTIIVGSSFMNAFSFKSTQEERITSIVFTVIYLGFIVVLGLTFDRWVKGRFSTLRLLATISTFFAFSTVSWFYLHLWTFFHFR